jgi:predicted RNase H-like nuclease (RuvC/YqgF family)
MDLSKNDIRNILFWFETHKDNKHRFFEFDERLAERLQKELEEKGEEKEVDYKFIIHYQYGDIANSTGVWTYNQAKEISEAIALWVKTTTGQNAEISIQEVETGNVEPFFY